MNVSTAIKILLRRDKKKQGDLGALYGVSKQTMSLKFVKDSWSIQELSWLLENIFESKLVIKRSDGKEMVISYGEDDLRKGRKMNIDAYRNSNKEKASSADEETLINIFEELGMSEKIAKRKKEPPEVEEVAEPADEPAVIEKVDEEEWDDWLL